MIKYREQKIFNELDKKMQKVLYSFDKSLLCDVICTSGKRSPEENASVGGVPNSSHLNGLAIDLNCADSKTRYEIIKSALIAGISRIGISRNHIHLDIDESKPFPIIFFDNM